MSTPIEELEAALAWADNKITPAQRIVLHNHSSESYCQASETILAAEVRRLETANADLRAKVAELEEDKARMDWLLSSASTFSVCDFRESMCREEYDFVNDRAAIDAARKEGA